MKDNPVISAQAIAAGVSTIVMALLGMLISLGVLHLDASQMDSVQAFMAALGALAVIVVPQLVAAFWAKKQVVTKAEVAQIVAQAQAGFPYTGAEQ